MVELQPNRTPSRAEVAEVLEDCASRNADFVSDLDFSNIKPILRLILWEQQRGLCVYCEKALPNLNDIARHKSLHPNQQTRIEHIKPRSTAPNATFIFANLALSCGTKRTCDQRKKDKELPLEPVPKVNTRFKLSDDGRLHPASPKKSPQYKEEFNAIEFLGLNDAYLIDERARTLREIYAENDIESMDTQFKEMLLGMPFGWTLAEYFKL